MYEQKLKGRFVTIRVSKGPFGHSFVTITGPFWTLESHMTLK